MGITKMAEANRYLQECYMPAFNAEFKQQALEEGTAFVPYIGPAIEEILCEHHDRTVGHDNCVRFENLALQIPPDRYRCNYIRAMVRVHRYLDGTLAIFHGPRKLATYDQAGKVIQPSALKAAA